MEEEFGILALILQPCLLLFQENFDVFPFQLLPNTPILQLLEELPTAYNVLAGIRP